MALSPRYVERIFARMLVRYGAAWIRMWEGIPMDAVQADWAEELAGFESNPSAIKHALDHLPPDKPPNVAQFAALCLRVPEMAPKALPAPKADPAVVAAVVKGIKPPAGRDPMFWAYLLRDREYAGEKLPAAHRQMWRQALRARNEESEGGAA